MPAGVLSDRVTVRAHPGGRKGAVMSLGEVASRAWAARADPRVRAWSLKQLQLAGSPTGRRAQVQALVTAYRKAVPYVPDPVRVEFMAAPANLLCLDDHGLCVVGGDCDDAALTCAACTLSVGIEPVWIVGAAYGGSDTPTHVYFAFGDDLGEPVRADATTSLPVGTVQPSSREWWIDPMAGINASGDPGGLFVGVGRAGAAGASPLRFGARPAAGFGAQRPSSPLGRPTMGLGLGLVTPSDVLSYRAAWDSYVMDTARACAACGDAWNAAAAGGQPSTPLGTSNYATPPTASVMQTVAGTESSYASSIVSEWNLFAGWNDAQVLLQAASILQSFQKTVLNVGQTIRPALANDCPALAATLPGGPSPVSQAQIIANIEGAGILTAGVLQVLGIGLGGGFEALGSASQFVAKQVDKATTFLTSPVTWTVLGTIVVAGTVLYLVENGEKVRALARRQEP